MQCVGVAELVKNQAVCGFVMTRKQFLSPARCIDSGRLNLNAGLRTSLGIGAHNRRRQAMRMTVDDAVHQSQQWHHEQSQGEVAAHELTNDGSEIHADLISVNGVNAARDQ